ncbi:hypothetical protein QWY87_00785 [Lutimonas halocynthiae]|uniref:hypothetical protein n=1 Tax=Lutimonas halocynthiae TaxID=1446477 RepID=UPI0025B58BAB|nr:hypothetical protein [Lutimonas halocynthiae]MDN3641217.1 hypothetical protein [Lutimonas halocynthiae]
MKLNYLFPHPYKRIGLMLLIPLMIAGWFIINFDVEPEFLDFEVPALFVDEIFGEKFMFGLTENNILNEIIGVALIICFLMVAFSKEKQEDELIEKIRLDSLVWATYANYAVLLFSMLFVFGISFFWVMICNMFTILLFFIIRFNWQVRTLNKNMSHEE